jgi:aspartyl-tRNA(Asn)/glutamyl-tRNA(Gln) amidotransferase subunit B
MVLTDQQISNIKDSLPELPLARALRFQEKMGLSKNDAGILTDEKDLADYFEQVAKISNNPRSAANWIMVELLRELHAEKVAITNSKIKAEELAKLIQLVDKGTISGKIAKTVFLDMWNTGKSAEQIVKEKGLGQVSDVGAIEKMVDEILAANASQVVEYRAGKTKVFGFFVGAAMKASKGQANPDVVNEILKKKLDQN